MRQRNGTDILGLNDPRAASIGIIYVSPNDGKREVLAAIITQDKLGRKQVVVVLPPQNKAFQRSADFDGLKSIRDRLQTEVIFIAPSGPGLGEFARQRNFPIFSSLESYTKSLKDEARNPMSALQGGLEMDIENSSGEERSEEESNLSEDDLELAAEVMQEERSEEEQRRDSLESLVEDRMYELREAQVFLAERAQNFTRCSTLVKASVIILGALVATKETISVVVGTSNTISIVGYTLAGILIAVLTGLEATFGWGTKSGKLATLAVTCRETRQRAELDRVQISSKENADANLALEKLLDRLMTKLQEVRNETIGFGLNPVLGMGSVPMSREEAEKVRESERKRTIL